MPQSHCVTLTLSLGRGSNRPDTYNVTVSLCNPANPKPCTLSNKPDTHNVTVSLCNPKSCTLSNKPDPHNVTVSFCNTNPKPEPVAWKQQA